MGRCSMVVGVYPHLDDMLASQYQSIDWTQHTTCQSSISWGNFLAPGTMYEKTSHEISLDLVNCFDLYLVSSAGVRQLH